MSRFWRLFALLSRHRNQPLANCTTLGGICAKFVYQAPNPHSPSKTALTNEAAPPFASAFGVAETMRCFALRLELGNPRGDTHFAQEARGAPRLPPCWWRRGGAKSPDGPLWVCAAKTASRASGGWWLVAERLSSAQPRASPVVVSDEAVELGLGRGVCESTAGTP